MHVDGKNHLLLEQYQPLILASASPRRRELLHNLGLEFSIVHADVQEEVAAGEMPGKFASRMAADKAKAVAKSRGDAWVLAADTIVVRADGQILGKPENDHEAREMLRSIAGCRHVVMTAYALINPKRDTYITRLSESGVTLLPMTDELIAAYVATGEPLDKAGSYALQGIGGAFVTSIDGSHSTVIGLPLHLVLTDLLDVGIVGALRK